MINKLAIEYGHTIVKFEEIMYLLSYLNPDTLEHLCLQNSDKISKNDNLTEISNYISSDTIQVLLEKQNEN